MSHRCPHCTGGTVREGHNYPAHRCPDCEGTSEVSHCEECDDQIAGDHELCHSCQEMRDEAEALAEFKDSLSDESIAAYDLVERKMKPLTQLINATS